MYEIIVTKTVFKVFSVAFISHEFKWHKQKLTITTKRKQTRKQTKSNKKRGVVTTNKLQLEEFSVEAS